MIEEKKMTEVQLLIGDPKSREFGLALAEMVAGVAVGKQHRLAPYLVDGKHVLTPGQAEGIMRHLKGCPDLSVVKEEDMGRARTRADAEAACPSDHIADIAAGFYATPSRTGNNDLDFWKVTEGRKPGVRFAKRVIGGGDAKYPRLVEISQPEQRTALGAILRTGISKSADAYADNQERCKKCGIHLTDDMSRAARMGPVCRGDR
jgi:Family of unknown function (DUF6011)